MEGDFCLCSLYHLLCIFQSTPSAWRETQDRRHKKSSTRYFNPLPPHGGRLYSLWRMPSVLAFQSTPSAWRETAHKSNSDHKRLISIHSLRMEGDFAENFVANNHLLFQSTPSAWRETAPTVGLTCRTGYFNPLPPHGGRQLSRVLLTD